MGTEYAASPSALACVPRDGWESFVISRNARTIATVAEYVSWEGSASVPLGFLVVIASTIVALTIALVMDIAKRASANAWTLGAGIIAARPYTELVECCG